MIISGQFNDSLPPIMDGVAVTAKNYAYWLNKNHAPSFAIGPHVPGYEDRDSNTLRFHSLRLKHVDPYRLGVPGVDRNFNRAIDEIPFDIVHAHCPFVSGNYAYTLAKKRRIPLIATFHSKYRDDFASWMKLDITIDQAVKMIVRFYSQADSVWVPNEAIIETLREYGYRGDIEYMPNGSDISLEDGEDPKALAEQGRELLKCDDASPVLLYLGQQRWVKNLRLLIESLALLRNNGGNFQMRFVGNGGDEVEMKDLVSRLKLNDRVKFIGSVYDRRQLRTIFAASQLMVFPSLYDNASLATREAAGFRVPTLFIEGATTANGIVDGQSGYLSENSSEAYADRIRAILEDSDGLRTTGEGAREFLYLSWEDVAAQVYDKYREIIDRYKHQRLERIFTSKPRAPWQHR